MSSTNLQFAKNFITAVKAMQMNGSYPFQTRNVFWWIKIFFVFALKIIIFYFLLYSIITHDIRDGHFMEASKNIAILFICVNIALKCLVLLYYRDSITELIRIIDEDYELAKQFPPEEQVVVEKYANLGRNMSVFWCLSASTGIMIFPGKAIVLTAYSFWIQENQLIPMFDMKYPGLIDDYKNNLIGFCSTFALCFTFAVIAGITYIGFDPLIPIFTSHTCGQLDILNTRMGRALSTDESTEKKKENLKLIIIKLQTLFEFIQKVKKNFAPLNEFNMKGTAIVMPLTMLNVLDGFRNNTVNIEFFIIWCGTLVHFLMPCYFGDLLLERSAAFREAIYGSGWENVPNKSIRQTILFMLTRATRPMGISTIFYTMNLDTFASMMHQAYSLFSLMNAAWTK